LQSLGGTVLTILQIAKRTGLTAPTIRYYEEIGILPEPVRSPAGQRRYGASDIERLTFVRRCRDFGFSLQQVRELLGLRLSPATDCGAVRMISQSHLEAIDEKLRQLTEFRTQVERFVQSCDQTCAGGPATECCIFEAIVG